MKKIFTFLAIAALAGCSSSDDESHVELYFTADGVQRPFFAEATDDLDEEGQAAVLVYADRDNEQVTFDVAEGVTGDNVVDHLEFIPDVTEGTIFHVSDVFFSEVTVNSDTRLKGNFSGNVTDGETEQYIECTFNIKKVASN